MSTAYQDILQYHKALTHETKLLAALHNVLKADAAGELLSFGGGFRRSSLGCRCAAASGFLRLVRCACSRRISRSGSSAAGAGRMAQATEVAKLAFAAQEERTVHERSCCTQLLAWLTAFTFGRYGRRQRVRVRAAAPVAAFAQHEEAAEDGRRRWRRCGLGRWLRLGAGSAALRLAKRTSGQVGASVHQEVRHFVVDPAVVGIVVEEAVVVIIIIVVRVRRLARRRVVERSCHASATAVNSSTMAQRSDIASR